MATATASTSGPAGVDALRNRPTSRTKPFADAPLAGARCSAASVLCHAEAAAGQLAVLSTAMKLYEDEPAVEFAELRTIEVADGDAESDGVALGIGDGVRESPLVGDGDAEGEADLDGDIEDDGDADTVREGVDEGHWAGPVAMKRTMLL